MIPFSLSAFNAYIDDHCTFILQLDGLITFCVPSQYVYGVLREVRMYYHMRESHVEGSLSTFTAFTTSQKLQNDASC